MGEITNLDVSQELLKDLKLFSGQSKRLSALLWQDYRTIAAACEVSNLYRYNGELFSRTLFYLKGTDQTWINSGQVTQGFLDKFVVEEKDQQRNLFPTSGENWDALLRIIEVCQERDIELRLIITPYMPAYIAELHDYPEWVAGLRAALPASVVVHDYARAMDDNFSFADPLHMNLRANREFTQILLADGVLSANAD